MVFEYGAVGYGRFKAAWRYGYLTALHHPVGGIPPCGWLTTLNIGRLQRFLLLDLPKRFQSTIKPGERQKMKGNAKEIGAD